VSEEKKIKLFEKNKKKATSWKGDEKFTVQKKLRSTNLSSLEATQSELFTL
jgi:hypothetical protein